MFCLVIIRVIHILFLLVNLEGCLLSSLLRQRDFFSLDY